MSHPLFWLLILIFLSTLSVGCSNPDVVRGDEDEMLARVYNRSLYLSEIREFFPPDQNPEDSLLRANAQIERWVRDALLMHEAERNIPKDLNIDKLVRDYRASLILHHYEQQLIRSTLDSIISAEEFEKYYELNKDQYPLEEAIYLPAFLKIPNTLESKAELEALWKTIGEEGNREELKGLCNSYELEYLLDESLWITESEIQRLMPEPTLLSADLVPGILHSSSDSLYTYHFTVVETLQAGEISPLSFIEDQIRMVIIHKRRLNILEERAEYLFDLESRKGNVEIY